MEAGSNLKAGMGGVKVACTIKSWELIFEVFQ